MTSGHVFGVVIAGYLLFMYVATVTHNKEVSFNQEISLRALHKGDEMTIYSFESGNHDCVLFEHYARVQLAEIQLTIGPADRSKRVDVNPDMFFFEGCRAREEFVVANPAN